jgi:lycopene beta-cyclase
MADFDYIIAGAGCAGLSLAYLLSKSTLADKKILLIDKNLKQENDRTWCFWTDEDIPFEHIVFRVWKQIEFKTENYHAIYPLTKLGYKIVRGIDFYAEVKTQLAKFPNIVFLQDTVLQVYEKDNLVHLHTNTQHYTCEWLFDSRLSNNTYQNAERTLLQHFKGYVIKTKNDVFDTSKVTMFDFRIEQQNEVRFVYTLPYASNKALVEFTIFGKKIYEKDTDYTIPLENYIKNALQIEEFEIEEQEFGIIPMTDFPFADRQGQRIKNIGILGGQSKPATGYTFLNIQRDALQTVQALETTGQPFYKKPANLQFKLYDKMILDIMLRDGGDIKRIFSQMFRNNPIENILYFLDNQTNFAQDLQIMASVPPLPFLESIKNIVLK